MILRRNFQPNLKIIKFRLFSIQNLPKKETKYSHTVNLPKTTFPGRLSAQKRKEIEKKIVDDRFSQLYTYQRNHIANPEFILHDGPPYANGELHMGHAVNKILKDITLRYHVINGRKVHYRPGWDCHGLPIELKATATTDADKDPKTIREKSRAFATETINAHRDEFISWGVLGDWFNPKNIYRTYDSDYIKNQLQLFSDFYKKDLIYRELKPVYWSPSSKSALAEAELEYVNNFKSPSIYLKLKLSKIPFESCNLKNLHAVIWTTTPWTLPSNQAICFNQNFKYLMVKIIDDENNDGYLIASDLLDDFQRILNKNCSILESIEGNLLEGTMYLHPFDSSCELSFLNGEHVESSKGTGLVHTAPAHGPDDFLISLKNNIKVKCLVNEEGRYTSDAPAFLQGKNVLDEGNDLIIKFLQNDILHSGEYQHSYPIDWRTKKPVILRASEQWFINTEKIKSQAISQIENVTIFPRLQSSANKNSLVTKLEKRPYWCISRQRAWGVPIPVFYDHETGNTITNESIINHICDLVDRNGNIDFWWTKDVKEILTKNLLEPFGKSNDDVVKGMDILDIWFDSGISWSFALDDDKIADLYLEGYDQFTGWFQSSLMTSVAKRGLAPYKSIFVHGFAVDEKGHKMSKSLGNVVLPKDITEKYGTDVLRWWVAAHATQHSSIIVSDQLLQSSAENLIKVRSLLKYLLGSIGSYDVDNFSLKTTNFTFLDKYMLQRLREFENEIKNLYKSYDYNRVAMTALNFIVNDLSAFYVNLSKDRLYCGSDNDINCVQQILFQCLLTLCKTLYPITPFLIEECWSYLDSKPFYMVNSQDLVEDKAICVKDVMNTVLDLRNTLNKQLKGTNTWILDVTIRATAEEIEILKPVHSDIEKVVKDSELCELLQVSSIKLITDPNVENTETKISVENNLDQLCPRCRRFSMTSNEDTCLRCSIVLKQKSVEL